MNNLSISFTHYQIEQQMKLYTESIQSKLDDSEKAREELLDQTKTTINVNKLNLRDLRSNI